MLSLLFSYFHEKSSDTIKIKSIVRTTVNHFNPIFKLFLESDREKMTSIDSRWPQMTPDDPKWPQMTNNI